MKQREVISDSGIRYNDYAVMVSCINSNRELNLGRLDQKESPFNKLFLRFSEQCANYRSNLERNWKASQRISDATDCFNKYLYNPVCYLSVGNTDCIAIILIDDLDPLVSLPSHIGTSIEQITLGFCPKLNSISVDSGNDSPFTEWHHLLGQEAFSEKEFSQKQQCGNVEHAFQHKYPLAVVTKFKLSGFSLLGFGVIGQRAIFKSMALKIKNILKELKDKTASLAESGLDINCEDVDLVKCIFMDSQGAEEITLFIACRNYTVVTTILAGLRSLTCGETFESGGEFKGSMVNDRFHRSLVSSVRPEKQGEKTRAFDDNHVFQSTYSILCASKKTFCDKEVREACTGDVEAYMHINVKPGHSHIVDDQFRNIVVSENDDQPNKQDPSLNDHKKSPIRRFAFGLHDLMLPFGSNQNYSHSNVIPTTDFFGNLYNMLVEYYEPKPGDSLECADLLNTSTLVVVPFPELINQEGLSLTAKEIGENQVAITPILEKLYLQLFIDNGAYEKSSRSIAPVNIKFETLVKTMRGLCIPWSLKRTISYLYQNFAHCITDPDLYPQVIDLFEAFEGFYRLLLFVHSQQESLIKENNWSHSRIFGETEIDDISDFVNSLDNALMHRSHGRIDTKEIRETAIDFRGGLNQLISATNAPLEASLSLVRFVKELKGKKELRELNSSQNLEHFAKVSAITRITFHPKTSCKRLRLIQGSNIFLAQVDMNVTHLLAPEKAIHFFHQASILLWRTLGENGYWGDSQPIVIPVQNEKKRFNPFAGEIVKSDRHAEIFAGLLQQIFIFGTDIDLFLKQYVVRYSIHPKSMSCTREEAVTSFTEILIRGFFITDPIRVVNFNESFKEEFPLEHPVYKHGKVFDERETKDALFRFKKMVDQVGPFYPQFNELWIGKYHETTWDYCKQRFLDIYSNTYIPFSLIWTCISELYNLINSCPAYSEMENHKINISKLVSASMQKGQPLSIAAPYDGGVSGNCMENFHDTLQLRSLCLITHMLYWQAHFFFDNFSLSKELYLKRNTETGEVNFATNNEGFQEGWNDFLIDSGSGQLFSVDPEIRRKRLLQQITAIKTYWDISIKLRAEKLADLITTAEDNMKKE